MAGTGNPGNQFYRFGGGLLYLDGREIGAVQNASINIAMETATLRDGTAMFPFIVEPAAGTITGNADYAILNADGASALFGEQVVHASGLVIAKNESQTITAGSITLNNMPHNDPSGVISIVYPNTAAGTVENFVPTTNGTPAAGQFFIDAGLQTITFNTNDNTKVVKCTYPYNSSSAATRWTLTSDSFPPAIDMVFAIYGRDRKTNQKAYQVVIARNVRLTNWTFGASNSAEIQVNNISFEIAADSGDIALEFYNPGG